MKVNEFVVLNELNYPGNIGVMEMVKFYKVASPEQKTLMKSLIAAGKTEEAWQLLQQVTQQQLQP
jgi:pentatricopeptide repeat protein